MVSLKLYVSLICMKHGRTTLVFTNKTYAEHNWYQNNRNVIWQVNNYTPGHVPICKCLVFNGKVGVEAQIRRKWLQLLLDGSDWCSTSSIVSQRGLIASRRLYTMLGPIVPKAEAEQSLGFYSKLFCVPKPGINKWRMIIDLRRYFFCYVFVAILDYFYQVE